MAKIGTGTEDELGRPLVEDLRAGHVARHQVGRELDPGEAEGGRLRERARDQRLGETRVVLEQHVAVAQQRQQDQLERPALADDRLLDLGEDRLRALAEIGERAHRDSIRSITAATCAARHARPVAVFGLRPVGAQQLPHVLAEQRPRRLGPALELEPVPRRDARSRRPRGGAAAAGGERDPRPRSRARAPAPSAAAPPVPAAAASCCEARPRSGRQAVTSRDPRRCWMSVKSTSAVASTTQIAKARGVESFGIATRTISATSAIEPGSSRNSQRGLTPGSAPAPSREARRAPPRARRPRRPSSTAPAHGG